MKLYRLSPNSKYKWPRSQESHGIVFYLALCFITAPSVWRSWQVLSGSTISPFNCTGIYVQYVHNFSLLLTICLFVRRSLFLF
jgi:hypothetical protein